MKRNAEDMTLKEVQYLIKRIEKGTLDESRDKENLQRKRENGQRLVLKLIEEFGELAENIRKNVRFDGENIKGTIEEEVFDVFYYVIAIANDYGIDLEKYKKDPKKEEVFRKHFNIQEGQKVVICAGLYFKRKGIEDFVEVARRMPDVRFIWLGSINKWIIPRKIRRIVEKDHPSNVEFPGYFKGAVFQGAMTGSDAFFFPSYEETEGIVVLEALASHQHTVLRDIPVYNGWIDETSSELCHNVDEFVDSLNKVLNGQVDKREAGYKVAESRSIDLVAYQLVEAYQTVLEM